MFEGFLPESYHLLPKRSLDATELGKARRLPASPNIKRRSKRALVQRHSTALLD